MNSQSGLLTLWTQGDVVTRTVALLLLTMSLASWMVIIIKALGLRQISKEAQATEKFWHARDFADGLSQLGGDASNPFLQLAIKGQEANAHLLPQTGDRELIDSLDRNEWVTRCLRRSMDEATAQLQSGLAVLAQAPLSELSAYQSRLNALTGGQGRYTVAFSHYEPVPPAVQAQLASQYRIRDDA